MATRSLIILDKGAETKKRYEYVYCHWDGYPDGVGRTLYEHYNTKEKIQELIDLGFISSLREEIHYDPDSLHSFNDPQGGVTVFYGRDRGEKDVSKKTSTRLPKDSEFGTEYRYLFTNGEWFVSNFGKDKELLEWEPLEDVLYEEDYDDDEPLGAWSGTVSKKKKKLASLLAEEDEDSFRDAMRYIIEHYLSEIDVRSITRELYEGF